MGPCVFVKEIKADMFCKFRNKRVQSLILALLRMCCSWRDTGVHMFFWIANGICVLSYLKVAPFSSVSQLWRPGLFLNVSHLCRWICTPMVEQIHTVLGKGQTQISVCLVLTGLFPLALFFLSFRTPLDTTCRCTAALSACRTKGQARVHGGCWTQREGRMASRRDAGRLPWTTTASLPRAGEEQLRKR